MSDGMSTHPTHALEAEVEVSSGPSAGVMGDAGQSIEAAYDVEGTAEIILRGGYKTIGLQFPDDLLPSSVAVYRALQARVGRAGAQCYVLADSTYGACCPDVLSCLHLPADLLVHYGHACLTPTDALPVHYVFPRFRLDPAAAFAELDAKTDWKGKEGVVVVWDVAYDWLQDDIDKAFSAARVPVSFARIARPDITSKGEAAKANEAPAAEGCCKEGAVASCCGDAPAPASCCKETETAASASASSCCKETPAPASSCCKDASAPAASDSCCAPASTSCCTPASAPTTTTTTALPATRAAKPLRSITPPPGVDLANCALWYLGGDGRSLLNLQMTHASNDLYAYDPDTGARECTGASRLLSRRLFAVHQALAADVFGLVVGNIGLASSRPLLASLRAQLAAKGKKSYTLSVGRLNPAKLANFADIECFVLVGCTEGGVVDSKDFLRPIITPYELTLALTGAEWDPSKWTLDLGAVLDATEQKPEEKAEESEDELEFSLVTGTYRSRKVFSAAQNGNGNGTPAAVEAGEAADGVKDLTLRSDFSVAKLESAGSMFLASRSFRGLEPRYGLDEPAVLEQGRSGIARGYTEEK